MNRSKWVAIATGAISLFLGVLYLLIVQFLDFRGEMLPAPIDELGLVPATMSHTMTLLLALSSNLSSSFPV